jgi:hypothetical protein
MFKEFAVVIFLGTAQIFAQPSFLYPVTIPMGAPVSNIAGGDFNNDGIGDFAVVTNQGGVTVFLGKSDMTFTRKDVPYKMPNADFFVAADVNHDGKLDLAGGRPFVVLFGNGDGAFQAPVSPHLAADVDASGQVLAIADFNGDGMPDVAESVHDSLTTQM